MLRFADLPEKHTEEAATLKTWDNRKPYEQAANIEIPKVVAIYYAGRDLDEVIQRENATSYGLAASLSFTSKVVLGMASSNNLNPVTLELGGKSPFKLGILSRGGLNKVLTPQIDNAQFQEIFKYIRSGIEGGATLETGGQQLGSKGYFIKPTVLLSRF
ncbi:hypothetical protein CCACVL1_03641 [Corchorus capsularis]|uniref:Aldehyde dehydrogenase domain-containing protein n=1 Tax=Corchorus capsularis TaxID=210143 RepID=A0A1R3JY93_COCAP|nr:hypothetical protein CCACVL1_03641 [Corchorus capsularis]